MSMMRVLGTQAPVLGVLCETAIHEQTEPVRLALLGLACLLSAFSGYPHQSCPDMHRSTASDLLPASLSGPRSTSLDAPIIEVEK
ncbi:hypothetical protein ACFYXJ_07535 [Streptomyces sp. NPDC002667]|uniref:hypothetical protein n=1 Tax=Streptomyces sp. NPDC002667 TaxID=3364657 RepID=UPI0036B22E7E